MSVGFCLGSGGLKGLGFQQPLATLSSWSRYQCPKRSAQGYGESQHTGKEGLGQEPRMGQKHAGTCTRWKLLGGDLSAALS